MKTKLHWAIATTALMSGPAFAQSLDLEIEDLKVNRTAGIVYSFSNDMIKYLKWFVDKDTYL